ncbi:MAG: sodium:proton antiporter [Peptococcaceae bacterium]|nr:sodium:proton antiporter [Peptococcaceae bacterium]
MGGNFFTNYVEISAVVLFCIGFSTLLFHQNLLKKIIGFNIMDTAIYLFLAAKGYIADSDPAIIVDGILDAGRYVNPLPGALVLTGIVVSVSVTAFSLALVLRLYEKYGTMHMDEILYLSREDR